MTTKRMRLLALIVLLGCDAGAPKLRTIKLQYGGLGIRHGVTSGYSWSVVVDMTAHTITATDPDGKPGTRPLEPREVTDFAAMAEAARTEPKIAQTTATDYHEQLDIVAGDEHFEVESSGPIERPAAKRLVGALNAAAHWPDD